MSRARWITLGGFVLLLSLLPLIPDRGGDDGAIRPAGRSADHTDRGPLTAGYGRVTPEARRAIDRVVAQTLTSRTGPTPGSLRTLVDGTVRCATFEGQRYCLGTGWTEQTQGQVQARTAALLDRPAARRTTGTATGDL